MALSQYVSVSEYTCVHLFVYVYDSGSVCIYMYVCVYLCAYICVCVLPVVGEEWLRVCICVSFIRGKLYEKQ